MDTVATGQFTLAGGSAEDAGIGAAGDAVLIKARQANVASVEVGTGSFTAGSGYVLDPGEFVSMSILNPRKLRFRGTAGDKITWLTTAP
jgi:hypothetical protein